MTLVLNCRDIGFDCDGVIRAETEEEILQQAAEHAASVHGVDSISPEMTEDIRSKIREE